MRIFLVTVGVMLFVCLFAAIWFLPCSRSNNLLLGRIEATVGSHTVVVTDCYRTSVPPPQKLEDSAGGQTTYQFKPCRDADVVIRGEELVVNGKAYGRLHPGDMVTVDHGKVLINDNEARLLTDK
jgi:hypothetical protein